jgi:GNAT superfamily N-acetyltransferase
MPTIRRALPADARAISDARAASWRAAYQGLFPQPVLDGIDVSGWASRAAVWLASTSGRGRDWVAEEDGAIVGWASRFLPGRDEDLDPACAEIVALYALPSHWGRGLGRALLEVVTGDLRAHGATGIALWVVEGNDRARRFYERQGFVADGRRADSGVARDVEVFSVRYRKPL